MSSFSFSYFSSCYFWLLLVVALIHSCYSNQHLNHVLCIKEERQALLQFKHHLIDEGDRLASWVGEKTDCCKWAGIVCDNMTGHVHHIHLRALEGHCQFDTQNELEEASKQKLKGDLRSFQDRRVERTSVMNMEWLSNLRLLRHLDMSNVDLSTAMDWLQVINTLPSLAELHLKYCNLLDAHPHVPTLNITSLLLLDLSRNQFTNSLVPQWIFSITSLISLNLSECGFPSRSAHIFRNLTSLKWFHVSGNNFINYSSVLKELSSGIGSNLILLDISYCDMSSTTLDSLHNLTSLLSLDLSWNRLANILPKSLGNFCNLRDIDLSGNYFKNISLTYLLESLLECKSPHLESLSISCSGISGHLPNQLGQLMHMKHLKLGNNHISGTIPDSMQHLSFLRTLNLLENQISGPIPLWIGRLSWLGVLDLSSNQLNGSLPNSIGRLSLIKELRLSYNQFNGSLPESIGRLSLLTKLDVSYNQLAGSLPNSIGQLSKLEELHFSSNFLTGVVTETHFVKLVHLKYLIGGGNNLTLRPRLANWIPPFQLESLNLNSWGLGPEFPLWLQLQKDLVYLDISETNISTPMPESLWRSFPNLEHLDISKNHLHGTLTLSGIPTTLELLDLSFNRLTGELRNFPNGSYPFFLDLSNNLFVGSLHHLLCSDSVKVTDMLNLGNNSLSGVIPECWEKWQSLSVLNLENNNFSGGFPRTLGHVRNIL
ncbi:leucine-rich repeat protein [Tanacetum coccineum]